MDKERCQDCRFLKQEEENDFRCHRYPPQMVAEGTALEMYAYASYPRISSKKFEWCGEFKRLEK